MFSSKITVNAQTQLYGILGNPVDHSLSPLIHNTLFHELNLNSVYLAFRVEKESLGLAFEAIRSLGIRGVNVTIPHKEAVLEFVDEIPEDIDRSVGALNTVVNRDGKLYGYNTDGSGFLIALKEELDFNPAGKNVLLLGAGGGARGAAFSLARARAEKILIHNRTSERAEGLVNYLAEYFPENDIQMMDSWALLKKEKIDLVVNATSQGMRDSDEISFNLKLLNTKASVYDLIYSPKETKLFKLAKSLGLPCANGLGMLATQAALSFELWTGKKEGVREKMLETLKKCLG